MSTDDPTGPNVEYFDPELESYVFDDRHRPHRVPVLLRPAGPREAAIDELEAYNARSVEKIARESIRAEIPTTDLERLVCSDLLEAIELERPIRLFDTGN